MNRLHPRAAGLVAAVCSWLFPGLAVAEQAQPWQMGFQEPASPVMDQILSLHNYLLIVTIGITLLVIGLLLVVVVRFNRRANPSPSRTSHNTVLEIAWTVVPVIVLITIAVPSFKGLYFMERTPKADMTIKVTGRQWYWDYEYPDNGGLSFSSIMVQDGDLKPGQPRLLDVDNHVVLPVGATVRILVTGGDVIHSWAIPAFGIKRDAVPGRLNETWVRIDREGVFYGQCSELCGVNHGYMPIAVEAVPRERFEAWVAKTKAAMAPADATGRMLAQTPAPAGAETGR
jgi:cytochrome c oxidase subunit 2